MPFPIIKTIKHQHKDITNNNTNQMYLYNMRNILLTIFASLMIMGCTSNTVHNTYNCKCNCEQCGSCSSPSDTLCATPEEEVVLIETDTTEGEQ